MPQHQSRAFKITLALLSLGIFTSIANTTAAAAEAGKTGKTMIQFPEHAIGRLFEVKAGMDCWTHDNIYGKFLGPAEGSISVDPHARLVLELDQRVAGGGLTLPDTNYPQIQAIRIRQAEKSDALINFLAKQKSLLRLDLIDCEYDDTSLTRLSGLTKLKYLNVRTCNLNGECFSHFQAMQGLEDLNASSNTMMVEAFKSIGNFKNLKKLDLARTGMTDQGLIYLSKNTSIGDLNLNSNGAITARGLRYLNTNKKLTKLRLFKTSITVTDVLNCFDSQKLVEIGVHVKPTVIELQKFHKKFPLCKVGVEGHANEYHRTLFAPTH